MVQGNATIASTSGTYGLSNCETTCERASIHKRRREGGEPDSSRSRFGLNWLTSSSNDSLLPCTDGEPQKLVDYEETLTSFRWVKALFTNARYMSFLLCSSFRTLELLAIGRRTIGVGVGVGVNSLEIEDDLEEAFLLKPSRVAKSDLLSSSRICIVSGPDLGGR